MKQQDKQTNKQLVMKPQLAFSMETVHCFPVIFSLLVYLSPFVASKVEI